MANGRMGWMGPWGHEIGMSHVTVVSNGHSYCRLYSNGRSHGGWLGQVSGPGCGGGGPRTLLLACSSSRAPPRALYLVAY